VKRFYAIPGLGTTKELFRDLKIKDSELIVLDWPETKSNYSLKDYAKCFIEKIDTSSDFYLVGVSLGGMICVELNDLIKPKKTFLISSSKSRKELPILVRLNTYFPLHKLLGEKLLRKINSRSGWILGIKKSEMPEFISMMDQMPYGYYLNTANYVVNWDRKTTGKNIFHLHGDADKLLPIKYIKADHVIENGTHAMIFYQAKEITAIIESVL
jgi:hypothetical protein